MDWGDQLGYAATIRMVQGVDWTSEEARASVPMVATPSWSPKGAAPPRISMKRFRVSGVIARMVACLRSPKLCSLRRNARRSCGKCPWRFLHRPKGWWPWVYRCVSTNRSCAPSWETCASYTTAGNVDGVGDRPLMVEAMPSRAIDGTDLAIPAPGSRLENCPGKDYRSSAHRRRTGASDLSGVMCDCRALALLPVA